MHAQVKLPELLSIKLKATWCPEQLSRNQGYNQGKHCINILYKYQ